MSTTRTILYLTLAVIFGIGLAHGANAIAHAEFWSAIEPGSTPMTVQIRADVTFHAVVIERADTGKLYRTPWCTDRYWIDIDVDRARAGGDFPRLILRCRAKQEARDR